MASNATVPEAFSFPPSQLWDGNDGKWSTFTVRLGTPPQNYRILPFTTISQLWIPEFGGCQEAGDPIDCGALRGVYDVDGQRSTGFLNNRSSTWDDIGMYALISGNNLRATTGGVGNYGLDTVGLTLDPTQPTFKDDLVALYRVKKFMVGGLGLGPKPTLFPNVTTEYDGVLQNLKKRNMIPSLTWGYTAGAAYRMFILSIAELNFGKWTWSDIDVGSSTSFGSLTFGGYDKSRFKGEVVNGSVFEIGSDDYRDLNAPISSIWASGSFDGPTALLLDSPLLATIDSSVSQLYFPREICDSFERVFGLTYDSATDLYLVNDTSHEKLLDLNPDITITLRNNLNGSNPAYIYLPYAALDLQVSYPMYNGTRNYFPIRRSGSSKATLGRVFLQEAYVIADYERAKFSIHPAVTEQNLPAPEIISIQPPTSQNIPQQKMLSGSSIAGIVLGSLAAGVLIFASTYYLWRHSRKIFGSCLNGGSDQDDTEKLREEKQDSRVYEMMGSEVAELEKIPEELPGEKLLAEADSRPIHVNGNN